MYNSKKIMKKILNLLLILSIFKASSTSLAPTLKLNDGYEMPQLALGTWLGNNTHGRILPKDEVEQAVEWAIRAGYRHIDTAFSYNTEPNVGRGLAKVIAQELVRRDDVFITTKLWNDAHARDAVVPALRASLHNLGLDYVDIYLIHWPIGQFANLTLDTTDYLETWRGMMEARSLNLTRSIGLSNFNQSQIDRILEAGLAKPAALQIEINLNLQQPDLLKYCKDKRIAVMAYTPFGSLFPGVAAANAPPPRVKHPTLVELAGKYNKTVPQLVLRYLIELGVAPLPKSLNKQRIEENHNIFDFFLTPTEKDTLRAFDKQYRTIPQLKWLWHPNFPFGDLVKQ